MVCHKILECTPQLESLGTRNALTYLQSSITIIISVDLQPNMFVWLGDILIQDSNVSVVLKIVWFLFQLYLRYRIKFHLTEHKLFAIKICCWGWFTSEQDLFYNLRSMQDLLTTEPPATCAKLQKFLCPLHWIKTGNLWLHKSHQAPSWFFKACIWHVQKMHKTCGKAYYSLHTTLKKGWSKWIWKVQRGAGQSSHLFA